MPSTVMRATAVRQPAGGALGMLSMGGVVGGSGTARPCTLGSSVNVAADAYPVNNDNRRKATCMRRGHDLPRRVAFLREIAGG